MRKKRKKRRKSLKLYRPYAIIYHMEATKKQKNSGPKKVSTFLMPEAHRLARSLAALKDLTLAEWLYEAALEKIARDK